MKNIMKSLVLVMVVVLMLAVFTACNLTTTCSHEGGTATCTEQAVCEKCGESYGETLAHAIVVREAVEATCTDSGMTEGSYCSVCSEVFAAQEVIPADGHNMAAATCDAPSTCTVCGHTEGEAIANHTINATYKNSVLTFACTTCSDVFTPANSVVYDGENTKYSITIQNADQKPNKGTLTVVDGAYKLESTVDEISLNNMDEERRTEFYRSLRTLASSISDAVKEI